jgi:hypothetical protein
MCHDQFDADAERDDSTDLGGAEGKAPISVMQTEFSSNQFANTVGQPNFSPFDKWKRVLLAGFLKKNHSSIILGPHHSKQWVVVTLQSETAVADGLKSFKTWLPLESFNDTKWIWPQ